MQKIIFFADFVDKLGFLYIIVGMMKNTNFENWLNGLPEKLRDLLLLYVGSHRDLILTMTISDMDSEKRIQTGSQINLLQRMYNEGVFGPPEKRV